MGAASNMPCISFSKKTLQKLVDETGHRKSASPTSRPIVPSSTRLRHRLFFRMSTRACQGVVFTSGRAGQAIDGKERITQKGLKVVVDILDTVYQNRAQGRGGFQNPRCKIVFDDLLPQWNYRVIPARTVI